MKYLRNLVAWVQQGINVSGWFRTWQLVVVGSAFLILLLFLAPVKVASVVALLVRALLLGSVMYLYTRILYHRRLHELEGDDRRWREVCLAIMACGALIAAGTGAIG